MQAFTPSLEGGEVANQKSPPLFSPMQAKTAADEVLQNPEEEKGGKGVSEAIPIPFLLLALAAAATR